MPRTYTPPPKTTKRIKHHLEAWRVCLTNSEKSEVSPSELIEKHEDIEMRVRTERKEMEYQKRLAEEAEAKKKREAEEEERLRRQKEESLKTMEELVVESVKMEDEELRDVP